MEITTDIDMYLDKRRENITMPCGELYLGLAKEARNLAKISPTPRNNSNMVYFNVIEQGLKSGKSLLESRIIAMKTTGRIK